MQVAVRVLDLGVKTCNVYHSFLSSITTKSKDRSQSEKTERIKRNGGRVWRDRELLEGCILKLSRDQTSLANISNSPKKAEDA